jgi:hypothetical protein
MSSDPHRATSPGDTKFEPRLSLIPRFPDGRGGDLFTHPCGRWFTPARSGGSAPKRLAEASPRKVGNDCGC